MNIKPKIWHLVFALCLTLFILRFKVVIDLLILLFSYIILLITDSSNALGLFSFELFDYLAAGFLIILLPAVILFRFRNRSLFQSELDFSSAVITTLLFTFVFAPLISTSNPDFQKNIGVTKLLPPMKSVNYLKFEKNISEGKSAVEKFVNLKNEIVKSSFDENIVFVDSAKIGENITYYQNEKLYEISSDSLKSNRISTSLNKKLFLLGTDEFGRDIFARLIYGARVSVFVGICSVFLSFILGLVLGAVSGFFGGIINLILNRITDTFLSFPAIFLIIIILALFGNSMIAVIFVLGFSGWMSLYKIVRTEVISLKQKDFFISAKMLGLSSKQLLFREVLPVILTPIVVNLVYQFGSVVLAEAALSYLGLGTGSSHPSWGSMIDAGQNYLKAAWWMIFFPGTALILTLYSANELGQKIKIHFNPQLKK